MKEHAKATLTMVGLPDREQANYNQLSEGQKQLCILARTFAGARKLLLLDEPESALDFRFRNQMMQHLRTYVTAHDACALVTLHDPSPVTSSLSCRKAHIPGKSPRNRLLFQRWSRCFPRFMVQSISQSSTTKTGTNTLL